MKDDHESIRLPRRMAPSAALFWYGEGSTPAFRPVLAGLYLISGRPELVRVREAVAAAVAAVPRLRQRVVEAPLQLGLPEWIDDPGFDIDYHLRSVAVAAPGGTRELLDTSSRLLAAPFDRGRPLWESYWLEGVERECSAYLFKLHHCLADALGAAALIEALTSETQSQSVSEAGSGEPAGMASGILARVAGLVVDNAVESTRMAWRVAAAPMRIITSPAYSVGQVWRTAKGLGGAVADAAASADLEDPLAPTGHALSRRLDVIRIPLQRLRRIAESLDVTINDVILTVLAGTIGAYHRQRRAPVDRLNCLVPMSVAVETDRGAAESHVGMVNIVLPVGEKSPERRLDFVCGQTRSAKRDKRGALYPFLVQALGMLPGVAFGWLAKHSLGRPNVACTNVRGPERRLYFAGAPVDAIYPFAGVLEAAPLAVALLSYAGSMEIGIDSDRHAVPDPLRITELFEGRLQEMEALAERITKHS